METYRGYRIKPNGWMQYVVMFDSLDNCIGATVNMSLAKAWIDSLVERKLHGNYHCTSKSATS